MCQSCRLTCPRPGAIWWRPRGASRCHTLRQKPWLSAYQSVCLSVTVLDVWLVNELIERLLDPPI